ncbi:uncharacterized protein LOC133308889 [Gastrolobium bilobum]|uniref:uncharacterized protein LOC133308889 n=1 Tax=Gastrolobium bilobum TaxID=150636 RepID=UPI002AB2E183|nr:uncharacterized protein LOC133308889 [Gastrolobium bilobum]
MAPMKIQPIDIDSERVKEAAAAVVVRNESVLKSRLRRLFVFERQFPRNNKDGGGGGGGGGGGTEFEPSSVCLAKMVQNFMEEQPPAPPQKCGRNRCNCFNANSSDEDDFDLFGNGAESITDSTDLLKSLIPCASVGERNLLAEASKIVEKNGKVYKRKEDLRKIVADGLSSLGYDSTLYKSKWEKTSSYPAGEYEFIDAIVEGERVIIDIDFRSEFDIARSTGTYKAILQSLPFIFVGKSERLVQIVSIVSEAAKQSLKKKGMPVPPWRKVDYMLAKWLSPSAAAAREKPKQPPSYSVKVSVQPETLSSTGDGDATTDSDCGELELIFGEKMSLPEPEVDSAGKKAESAVVTPAWQPPAVKPKSVERGAKVVTGLASLLKDKP